MGGTASPGGALKGGPAVTALPTDDGSRHLRFSHDVAFGLTVALARTDALAFVRDAGRSLRRADFLEELSVASGPPPTVSAQLPVHAAPFGARRLPFTSEIVRTAEGARLVAGPPPTPGSGWAEVGGEAWVTAGEAGPSRLDYRLTVTVTLALPAAERWGMRALLKMVELAGAAVLRRVVESLPSAVEAAALEEVAAVDVAAAHAVAPPTLEPGA